MRRLVITILLIMLHFSLSSQVLEFDQLEMRYDQRQYKSVYQKANKLQANPQYDYSFVPRYYIALSKLQLAQNPKWLKKNKFALEEATKTFEELQSTREGQEILRSHQYEMSVLKSDLMLWTYNLNEHGDRDKFNKVDQLIKTIFKDVPDLDKTFEIKPQTKTNTGSTKTNQSKNEATTTADNSDVIVIQNLSSRDEIVKLSEGLLGIPYKYAGVTPSGFDCSGFTNYVIRKTLNKNLSQRAADQFKEVRKINRKDLQLGDFIFFSHGKGINHVGIVYSLENDSVQMIHSSSSIGISIVDIYESDYWRKRIVGFGTVVEE